MINIKGKKYIIGVIHLLPTLGFAGFTSVENIIEAALQDLSALEQGGVDAVMVENNYDLPHTITTGPETTVVMSMVISKIKQNTTLPVGISVLWNDYTAALALAKIHCCDFIRIPVFVDTVQTDFGIIQGKAEEVLMYRKKIGAENVQLFTDIQVKHSVSLDARSTPELVQEAIDGGSQGIIVTGAWTGNAPLLEKVRTVTEIAGNIPVIIGSGADKDNVIQLLSIADAVIVSTSLKDNTDKFDERNVKHFSARINLQKVREFVDIVKKVYE